jgi:hypothetical protein
MKSGNLNLLESSGPLQACKGTALHFILGKSISILGQNFELQQMAHCKENFNGNITGEEEELPFET